MPAKDDSPVTPVVLDQNRREFDIDPYRGLVCLSLIVLHFYHNAPEVVRDRLRLLIGEVGDFAIYHLRLGVESFFILAGFMMAHMLRPAPGESVSVRGYLVRRFFRLILPYWCAVLLATADRWGVALVFKGGTGTDLPGVREVLAQMFLVNEFFTPRIADAAVGYWSMVALEQFYLLWLGCYFVFRKLLGAGHGGYGKAEVAMAWLTLAACCASAAILIAEVDTRFQLPKWAMYLTLGQLLYWAIRQKFARPQFLIAVAVLAAVAIITLKSRPISGLVSVAILIALARGRRLPTAWVFRALAWCGRRSYSLYLMHPIAGIRILSIGKVAADYGNVGLIGLVVAAFVATFVVAEVFYRLVELPCQARARKVDYRGRKNLTPQPPSLGGKGEQDGSSPLPS